LSQLADLGGLVT